jgi:hypothetical protein
MDLKSAASVKTMVSGAAKIAIVGAFIALLTVGIIVYSRSQRHEIQAAATQPVPVIATRVSQHDVPIILTGLGTVTALNSATIRSQVTGLLISVNFQEGQEVRKGELACPSRSTHLSGAGRSSAVYAGAASGSFEECSTQPAAVHSTCEN